VTVAAPAAPPRGQPGAASSPASVSGERPWRRLRTPVAIAAVVLLGVILIALFSHSGPPANGYLDPSATSATGTHALADILAERGTSVVAVTTAGAASAAVARGASAVVITSPELLTRSEFTLLARTRAELVLVEPDPAALRALAPGVAVVGAALIAPLQPDCALPAAVLAGNADMGGIAVRQRPGLAARRCYVSGEEAFLLQYSNGRQQVTILGTGAPLENQYLDKAGNAALALNLLGNGRQIAWLTPQPALQSAQRIASGGAKSIWSLIPLGAYLVALQLGIALLLTALWRGRRLGPLTVEPVPVVVRASETAEGHAQLYQARRSRDQAAAALREATLRRLSPALGLPAGASAEATTAALVARSARGAPQLRELLFGPAPASDTELVKLAEDLDAMEREVRAE
jgi:hypothetical protein